MLTQFGVTLPLTRLRQPDALEVLERRGLPEVWRRSVAEALAVVDWLDERLTLLERELGPLARADRRVALLVSIPGVAELLGLTLAVEIGDVARFPEARKLVGYSGLTPRVAQSGQSSPHRQAVEVGLATAALGRDRGRPAGVEAGEPVASPLPRRQGALGRQDEPAKAAVARKVLIAAWHVLALEQPFKLSRPRGANVPASSRFALVA